MLQPPAGNVRFYPAIKINHNFNIDLIKSFFTVFFLFYLHNWRNSVITSMGMADVTRTSLGRRSQVGPAMTGPFFSTGKIQILYFHAYTSLIHILSKLSLRR